MDVIRGNSAKIQFVAIGFYICKPYRILLTNIGLSVILAPPCESVATFSREKVAFVKSFFRVAKSMYQRSSNPAVESCGGNWRGR